MKKKCSATQRARKAWQNAKVGKVMHEFKQGTLKSSAGPKVKKRSMALAIAMSEAGRARKK